MAIDRKSMSLKELEQRIVDAKAAIGKSRQRERDEARAAVEKLAAEHGFSLNELAGGKSGKKKAASGAAKYANPENPMQTWTGKGRQPGWYKEAVSAGTPPEAMEL